MPAASSKEQLTVQGALVEAWLEGGEELSSPSVQGTIHPGTAGQPGLVEVLSSHEQVLGGASGQTYLGCSFPAAERYRAELPTGEVLVARSQSGIKAQIRSALTAETANCVLAA